MRFNVMVDDSLFQVESFLTEIGDGNLGLGFQTIIDGIPHRLNTVLNEKFINDLNQKYSNEVVSCALSYMMHYKPKLLIKFKYSFH